uniref:DOMON domain-containing protein n=1 Tax=Panagrellus redivivus TaxID=6233 RepID=A0A7E4VJ77_PANRE
MWASFAVFCIALISASASATSKQFHLDPEHCSFSSDRYSVQWAYEPHSKNVVFVLKQRSELKNFWTGIGFGDRKKEVIDFIGVFVKNGQIGIADTYINPDEGTIHPDASTNVQSIAFDYDVINKTVTAKFARSLKSPDIDFDRSLDKCITFNFAYRGGRITRADIRPDLDELIEKRVCDIAKYCEVDLHSTSTTDEPVRAPSTLKDDDDDHIAPMVIQEAMAGDSREAGSIKDKPEKPEIAASVDISGTGDPCSFTGAGYTVDWTYDPDTDLVDFVMKHRVRDGKWWSAVGIGDNMSDMDIAIIFVSYGRPKRIRDYFSNSYGVPTLDETQDWTLSKLRTKSVDGMVELGFSRKLETDDPKKDRSLDGCVLFQFAANAGHYSTGFEVRKHEEWPDLYKACDIKKKCIVKDADKHGLPETSDNLDESTEDEEVENVVVMDKRAKKPKPEESEAEEIVEEETVTKKPKKGNGNGNGKKNNKNNNKKKTTTTAAPTTTEATTTESTVDETLAADEVLEGKSGSLDEMDESATTNLIIQSELNGLSTTTASESEATDATNVAVEGATAAPEAAASEAETIVASEAQTTVASEVQTTVASEESTAAPETETTVASEGSTVVLVVEPLAFEVSSTTSEAKTTSSPSEATTVSAVETTLPEAKASETAESSTLPSISFDLPGAATTTEAPSSEESTAWTERTVQFVTFTYPPHIMPMVNGELNPFYKPTEPSDATTEATTGGDEATTEASAIGGEATTAAIAAGIEATTQFRGLMAITMSSEEASAETTGVPESSETSQEDSVQAAATTEAAATSDSVAPLANDPSTGESSTVPAPVSPPESVPSDGSTVAPTQLSDESPNSESSTVPAPESSPESPSSEVSTVAETNESPSLTTPSGSGASEPTSLPSLADILGGITGAPSGEAVTGESAATSGNPEASEASQESTLPSATTAAQAVSGGIPGEDGNPVDTGIGDVVVPEEEFIHEPTTGTTIANATENESSNSIENETEAATTLAAEVEGSGEGAEEGETSDIVSGTTESSANNAVDDASSVTLPLTPITVTLDVITTTAAAPSGAGSESGNAVSDSEVEATTESETSSESATTSESTPATAAATTQAIVPLESTSENTSDGPEVEGSGESAENIDTTTAIIELSSTPEPGPFTGTDEELRAQLGDAAIGDPKKEGCGTGHEDYSLCGAYFTNYLDRVRNWAEANNEPYEDQFGKACTLLSQVRNVKTLCCTIFVDTCKGKIEF